MRMLVLFALGLVLVLAACAPGTSPALPTGVPPQVATGAAQAPTLGANAATTAAGAVNAAETEAAQVAPTIVPPAQTSAAGAQSAIGTAVAPYLGGRTPEAEGTTVDVKLADSKIDMPATVKSGLVTFRVTNTGTAEHSFEVDGQGVLKKLDNSLKPGGTATLQVQLQPGTYKVYSPVGNDRTRGLEMDLTVTP